MQFSELKTICYEHDKLIEKSDIIEESKKNRMWLKIVNPKGREFCLSDVEINVLMECINKKGLEIEKTIYQILNNKGE